MGRKLGLLGMCCSFLWVIIFVPNPFSSYPQMKHAQQNMTAANNAVAASCQNMNNATLNLAKFTTLSDPNLTNAVAQYNRSCAQITGPFDVQKMIATNNAMVTACQNVKITTENLSRYAPSNDPNLVSGLSQYNDDCTRLTGPLNLQPAGSDEMTVSCQNEKAAILNLARYTTLNDPRLLNGIGSYTRV